ncbi:putative aminopeptidase [Chitinispirillum alkaliphilum]|nr:putative aminopeptidase [Chitinispirillum alkaliphilum]
MRAEKIEDVLACEDLSSESEQFLTLVLEIREYAIDTLGLKNNSNYLRYVATDRDYMVDVVSAAKDDSFEMYRWWFPFFGRFPYKGYFEKKDALREAARLERKGYDVHVGQARAFSTLGFFSDPVYSFMKKYTVYELASLIIHEQVHATVFLKDQIQFNEEIATFIGNTGGLYFVEKKFGRDSKEYNSALLMQRDSEVFVDLIRSLHNELDEVYNSETDREEKLTKKEKIVENFKEYVTLNYDAYFQTGNYKGLSGADINNAFIASRMTYTLDLSLYEKLYEVEQRNLRAFVSRIKELKNYRGDPKEYIKNNMLNNE